MPKAGVTVPILSGFGMITPVGLDAPSSCAALRCGIQAFRETDFHDAAGEEEPLIGAAVPFIAEGTTGLRRLLALLAGALRECAKDAGLTRFADVPILLGIAEQGGPGFSGHCGGGLLEALRVELGQALHPESRVLARGKTAFAAALGEARQLHARKKLPRSLVACVDVFLDADILEHYGERRRLKTELWSDGFIPGEAAAAVMVDFEPKAPSPKSIRIYGLGFGRETAVVDSELPLRGDGSVQAVREALADSGLTLADIDFRLCDVNGEQYGFKEAALTVGRLLRTRKPAFELWQVSHCIGEVGAAVGACLAAFGSAAIRKHYAPGRRALVQLSADSGERAAFILGLDPVEGDRGQ